MALSRAASSLGVAVALGEVDRETPDGMRRSAAICRCYSSRASASAGVELTDHEIVVLGAAPGWRGPLRIAHGVMGDAIDIEPVRAALGVARPRRAGPVDRRRSARVWSRCSPRRRRARPGALRGHRHTMLDDSDISSTRHARGFVAGALAGLVGHAEIYVSGGAEHQGPDGGGPVAIIADSGRGHRMSVAEMLHPRP